MNTFLRVCCVVMIGVFLAGAMVNAGRGEWWWAVQCAAGVSAFGFALDQLDRGRR